MKIRVGTRASELARSQTAWVVTELRRHHADLEVEEILVRTRGDADRVTPLERQGGVGLFTKELERALLDREIDLAVHSLKDLPTAMTAGLVLAATPVREEPWDVWISDEWPDLIDLPPGAKVATGSPRRRLQILHRFPHLEVIGIRGNIDTRLERYRDLGAAGVVLAAAGLRRTGRADRIRAHLGPSEMTPAPGQGALGLETRAEDHDLIALVARLDHAATRAEVTAERHLLALLEAGCSVPVGALARASGAHLTLLGMVVDDRAERLLRLATEGSVAQPLAVAEDLYARLLASGGAEIVAALREAGGSHGVAD
ncbi:MAG: hydroxymethylbilane synthase [Planctomycetota bacterium]